MPDNFDSQWKRRSLALASCHSLLSDEKWQSLTARAWQQPSVIQPAASSSRRRALWPVSIAAAVAALIMVGISLHGMPSQPKDVVYSGQSVRFICNNQCNAQSTIDYFDNYIGKLGSI